MDALGILRFTAGTLLLCVIPGVIWARVLVPSLSPLERFVVGVVLSISFLVLILYVGNVAFGLPIKPSTAIIASLFTSAAGLVPALARRLRAQIDRWSS